MEGARTADFHSGRVVIASHHERPTRDSSRRRHRYSDADAAEIPSGMATTVAIVHSKHISSTRIFDMLVRPSMTDPVAELRRSVRCGVLTL